MFQALICFPEGPYINDLVLQHLPCLKLVVTTSTGIGHIDLSLCHFFGIQVANFGNLSSQDVADMAVALLIGVLAKIPAANTFFRNGLRDFAMCFHSKVCFVFFASIIENPLLQLFEPMT